MGQYHCKDGSSKMNEQVLGIESQRKYVYPFVLCNPLLGELCEEFVLMYHEGREGYGFQKDILLSGGNKGVNEVIARGLQARMNGSSSSIQIASLSSEKANEDIGAHGDKGLYLFNMDYYVGYFGNARALVDSFERRKDIGDLEDFHQDDLAESLCSVIAATISDPFTDKRFVCIYGVDRRVNHILAERVNGLVSNEGGRQRGAFHGELGEKKNTFYLDADVFFNFVPSESYKELLK